MGRRGVSRRPTPDLSTIPDAELLAEVGRRRGAKRQTFGGGRKPSCACGACPKCIRRERMRQYRAKRKKTQGKK